MVKVSHYETSSTFDYSWKQVVQAFWNRYPNPSSAHVLTEDVVKRDVIEGKLYTRRLLSKTNPLPKWGERFYNAKSVKIIEDSILDPKTKILVTYTRNVGFKKVMKVDEKVEYRETEDGKTIAIRSAWVSSQIFGFSAAIRAFGVERFKSNCNKTVAGFNYVLCKMFPSKLDSIKANEPSNIHSASQYIQQHQLQPQLHNLQQSSKITKIKNAGHATYIFVKNQANKVYQLFSVSN
ncbi:protein preli-like [Condylostylus longicornis]|uniref:protein preli-like n=1 Tax=Condylostylus longicornis TaxID=2530218 RepID=UPI00244DE8CF|nr:protein preli-like [Condylostylus longicornis]